MPQYFIQTKKSYRKFLVECGALVKKNYNNNNNIIMNYNIMVLCDSTHLKAFSMNLLDEYHLDYSCRWQIWLRNMSRNKERNN